MGLEATCGCRTGAGLFLVKALLETQELILRQGIRRTFPIASLTNVRVADGELRFVAAGEEIALELGEALAARWLKKLTTPPPTLAQKLGIGPGSVVLFGTSEDGVIEAACAGSEAAEPTSADLLVAIVENEADLDAALVQFDRFPAGSAIWCVYRKGPRAAFGETPVRTMMRGRGFIDTKVSAVSALYSATKYIRR